MKYSFKADTITKDDGEKVERELLLTEVSPGNIAVSVATEADRAAHPHEYAAFKNPPVDPLARIAELESQLADKDKQIADLNGELAAKPAVAPVGQR